jgi:hypothetical protein
MLSTLSLISQALLLTIMGDIGGTGRAILPPIIRMALLPFFVGRLPIDTIIRVFGMFAFPPKIFSAILADALAAITLLGVPLWNKRLVTVSTSLFYFFHGNVLVMKLPA